MQKYLTPDAENGIIYCTYKEVRTTDIITESDFRKSIVKSPARGYLFFGDEDYLKSFALKTAREAICPDPSLAPFNDIRLEGLDLTPDALLGAITTLPMMSERKLVTVSGMNFSDVRASKLDEYCKVLFLLEEYDYNTVIISVPSGGMDAGALPKKPSSTLKKLAEYLVPVHFTPSTPLMLSRWVARHFNANSVRADAAVCSALVDYCGTDMHRLSTETDKLSWYAISCGRDYVSPDDIKRVAIADTSYDTFAMTNAVMDNNKSAALAVLSEMKRKRIEPTLILGEVTRVFCDMLSVRIMTDEGLTAGEIASRLKIHEYRVKLCLRTGAGRERLCRIVELCAEADTALKLSQGYGAIEQLICSL